MKILKVVALTIFSLICVGIIFVFEIKDWPAGSSLAGIALGFSIPALFSFIQDLTDTTKWKVSQRRLERGKFINKDTFIRISFAYLFRIKIDNKYFLVMNSRNTGKYQPVGGVYKYDQSEYTFLKNKYHVVDDDKISSDSSSRLDYRLTLKNQDLRSFLKRFNSKKSNRERIEDASREFKEELINTGVLSWTDLEYRVCGRHITEIKYSEHFQIYELLLADIVEVNLTPQQESDLRTLMSTPNSDYRFAKSDEIKSLGIDISAHDLRETIADHTIKILQETEGDLTPIPGVKRTSYSVTL